VTHLFTHLNQREKMVNDENLRVTHGGQIPYQQEVLRIKSKP
jgi:hypothetical protein